MWPRFTVRPTSERDEQVAIKLPHPEMEGDQIFAERFQREQEIGKHFDHPGVMKVIPDDHRTQNYMVTEWVEGKLLRQILSEEKKISAERAVKIALGICQALGYIHNHGIVHRDLKPEHVMVDSQDHIKLVDFGLAGQTGARRITFANLSQLTSSPEYISPEQVKGKRGDARSDLYALGVMLYEMVTGRVPFLGANAFAIMNDRLLRYPIPPREIDRSISPAVAGSDLQGTGAGTSVPLCERARFRIRSRASRSGRCRRAPGTAKTGRSHAWQRHEGSRCTRR